jgi:ATP-binding cassette subfamily C protein
MSTESDPVEANKVSPTTSWRKLKAKLVDWLGLGGRVKQALTEWAPTGNLQDAIQSIREHFVICAVLSAGINILYLAPSLYMLQVYDRVLVSGSMLTLVFLSLVGLLALLTLAALDGLRSKILSRMGLRLDLRLARLVMQSGLDARGQGRNDVTAVRDLDTVRQTISSNAATTLMDLPWTPIYLLVAYIVHPLIFITAFVGMLILLGLTIWNDRASRKSLKLVAETAPRFYNAAEADLRVAESVRAMGLQPALVSRRVRERENLVAAQMQAAFVSANFTSVTKFVRLVLQSAALGIGAYLALRHEMSPGAIIAGTILTTRAFGPIEQVVGAWRQFSQAFFSYRNLQKLLAAGAARQERTRLPAPRGRLALENVGARPPGTERPSLANVTLQIEPGEVVGVIGPSGAGKSTLARVCANATLPIAGAIRIDGAKMTDWQPEELAEYIGYLPQSVDLMMGTVGENISRFGGDAGMPRDLLGERIVEAAKAAGAHDMILRLPQGYDTPLGPGGAGVSAGQAQRIALARALYGAPILLVLDEPNAHLDSEGEAALTQALRSAKARGAICIVVAHRAGVMSAADKILVLQDGRVADFGPRDQIASKLAVAAGVRPAVAPTANAGERG